MGNNFSVFVVQIVKDPSSFDVMVMPNLYGDILRYIFPYAQLLLVHDQLVPSDWFPDNLNSAVQIATIDCSRIVLQPACFRSTFQWHCLFHYSLQTTTLLICSTELLRWAAHASFYRLCTFKWYYVFHCKI